MEAYTLVPDICLGKQESSNAFLVTLRHHAMEEFFRGTRGLTKNHTAAQEVIGGALGTKQRLPLVLAVHICFPCRVTEIGLEFSVCRKISCEWSCH